MKHKAIDFELDEYTLNRIKRFAEDGGISFELALELLIERGLAASSRKLGRGPKFKKGQTVEFECKDRSGLVHTIRGVIEIVDNRQSEPESFKGCGWSYDVMVEGSPFGTKDGRLGPCLHKHIPECDLRAVE